KSVRLATPPPVGAGTRAVGRVRVMGISVEDPVEVTAFEPPTHFAIRHKGLIRGGGDIRLAPGADGTSTVVTWDETLIPPLLPHLGAFVLGLTFEPIFRRDLERLAWIVEGG
ncbi:MAG TPA: SRPBCC family protein, partial [Candidatus Sulfomarinibacteraceae bacterium]|nr:SRPBCC family protein [Candidatus Sulfomarinibacteraceae bacterium]